MQTELGSLRETRRGPFSRLDGLIGGVELGGTKCVCSLATADGTIVDQAVIGTTDPVATVGAIEARLMQWREAPGFEAPGFAAPGIASLGPVDLDPRRAACTDALAALREPCITRQDLGGGS